ncbi:MAG: hypothetical protein JO112_15865, partial [Planctomycetes bacterium]|nr:hypothetical protein [Planctomycetota bacterium]
MRFPVRGPSFQLAALALVVLSLSATGFLMARMLQAPEAATDSGAGGSPEPRPQASHLFLEWPHDASPDLVLLLSGEQHGYIQPCGCSKPQYGGLERRFNLLKSLIQGHGWHVVPLDLGDIAQHSGPQALLKYKYSMEALHQLNYQAVSVGMNEMTMPLLDALAQYTLNSPQSPRVLVSNLQDKETNFPDMIGSWKVVGGAGQEPKVGVVGVVASSVGGPAQKLDRDVLRFQPAQNALNDTLRDGKFLAQTDLLALLFQGSLEEAQACAKQFPQFRIILCLTKEEEPPANPTMVGNTMIINVGHKGRYVGLVGIYRTNKPGQPFDLYYQLMQVGPEYETAQGKDADNPILALLENYTQEVRRGNYLAHYPKTLHPVQRQFPKATYVGSEVCQKCHPSAYQVWKN